MKIRTALLILIGITLGWALIAHPSAAHAADPICTPGEELQGTGDEAVPYACGPADQADPGAETPVPADSATPTPAPVATVPPAAPVVIAPPVVVVKPVPAAIVRPPIVKVNHAPAVTPVAAPVPVLASTGANDVWLWPVAILSLLLGIALMVFDVVSDIRSKRRVD